MQRHPDKEKGDNPAANAAGTETERLQASDASSSPSDDDLATVVCRLARQLALAAVRVAREQPKTD